MKDMDLAKAIQYSLDSAVKWSTDNNVGSNALRSAAFVSNLGDRLFHLLADDTLFLNVINVTQEGKKEPGEWLLDITITENAADGFRKKIVWAVESESNCSKKAFYDDFAKLIHVNAENHLYLNGINHNTEMGRESYIKKRLKLAEQLVGKSNKNLWFCFWASPCKSGKCSSNWNEVHSNGALSHLNRVLLYRLENEGFIMIDEVSTK
jgi:hypothetical protein